MCILCDCNSSTISIDDTLPSVPAFPEKYSKMLKIETERLDNIKGTKAEKQEGGEGRCNER